MSKKFKGGQKNVCAQLKGHVEFLKQKKRATSFADELGKKAQVNFILK